MDRFARFIVGHSRRILAATVLITIASGLMLFRMDFNADVASFVLEGHESGEAFLALQEKYDTSDPVNVIASLPEGRSYGTAPDVADLVRLRDSLATVAGVRQVSSIVPDVNPLTGVPLTPGAVAVLPDAAIARLLGESPLAELLVSPDARHSLIQLVADDDPVALARRLDDVTPPSGMELTLSGNPVVFARILDVLSLILLLIPPLVIGLLLAVFYATIGDRRLSILAILPAAFGSLWTFGLIFALGLEVDIVTVLVPIFVIVMGSADGLHFVSHFQEEAASGADVVERVRSALAHVGVPMILTTISTSAGFLSLLATDVHPIRQLGLFAAIGIGFAGVISFFSLPALVSRLHIEPSHHHALLGPRVTRGLRAVVRRRIPAVALTLVLLAFAAVFVPRLDVNSDQLFYFKADDPVRLAFERTEELFGGATPLAGEFVRTGGDAAAQAATIRAVSADLEALPGVREVFSVADLATVLPAEQFAAVWSGEVELPLGDLVSDDGLRFVMFPAGFTTDDLLGWVEFAATRDEIRVLTGMPIVWDDIARLVLRAQLVSVLVAFALVAALLALAYRRLRETLVALVPIALTILTLLGFIAASGIQLTLITAIVSSIVIGVGIDYAIHFIAAIDYARRSGPGYVLAAIDRAGRPIVANALGIAVALTALWLSPLRAHNQLSMIMWVAMTTAAATALVVVAALMPADGLRDSVGTPGQRE